MSPLHFNSNKTTGNTSVLSCEIQNLFMISPGRSVENTYFLVFSGPACQHKLCCGVCVFVQRGEKMFALAQGSAFVISVCLEQRIKSHSFRKI